MATTTRKKNLAKLTKLGFKVAASLPTKRGATKLRSAKAIAARFSALRALFLWVASPERLTRKIELRSAMTPSERTIYALPRDKARAQIESIGWRLENMWPLAWMLGFDEEPSASGDMIEGDTVRALLAFEPAKKVRSERAVLDLEDLFYCAHNAARSAQLGGKTAPKGFHPIAGTGVIHERRHALTWAVSPKVAWDDTDLST